LRNDIVEEFIGQKSVPGKGGEEKGLTQGKKGDRERCIHQERGSLRDERTNDLKEDREACRKKLL